jgi:hypothetical protein
MTRQPLPVAFPIAIGAGASCREFLGVVRPEFVQHVFELAHRKYEQALVFVVQRRGAPKRS